MLKCMTCSGNRPGATLAGECRRCKGRADQDASRHQARKIQVTPAKYGLLRWLFVGDRSRQGDKVFILVTSERVKVYSSEAMLRVAIKTTKGFTWDNAAVYEIPNPRPRVVTERFK